MASSMQHRTPDQDVDDWLIRIALTSPASADAASVEIFISPQPIH